MAVERFAPGATGTAAIGRGLVASSFQYYLSGDEALRVTVECLTGARDIEIAWRLWREQDRQIILTRDTFKTGAVGPSSISRTYPLDAGALINLRLACGATSIPYGLVWVRAQIVRGAGGAEIIIGTLLQGFLSTQNDLGWPGSPIEKQDQASGFIISEIPVIAASTAVWTVPVGERWKVVSGRFQFACSGVAANRYATVFVSDGSAQVVYLDVTEIALVAGATGTFSFASGVTRSPTAPSGAASLSWPADLEINAGCSITAQAFNLQAGDVISNAVLFVRTRVDG